MLKALELVGFKSFADRTRFDFPDGITVVVGPNGSGKSNVVDAVKWVLGAQSAKALRGADMADVIFKGSAEGGRKPANSAEVVLVLDNSNRIFHNDAEEVQVCRRVFRSGEGEYAINGQPCRLKDVKDLFRGTGVGVDAYSLIEQGKVDRLLQASAKDRRGIFEEAAGISRFKAKKVEAERRLQRVEQNLLRLGDIVDEVGKRLATLKSQASKAQRYREVSHQLHLRRSELGWIEIELLRRQRSQLEKQTNEAEINRDELQLKLVELEDISNRERSALQSIKQSIENLQDDYLKAQRDVIAAENGARSAKTRVEELKTEQSLIQERLLVLEEKASLSEEERETRELELQSIAEQLVSAKSELLLRESRLSDSQSRLRSLSEESQSCNTRYSELNQWIQDAKSKIVGYQFHLEQSLVAIEEASVQHAAITHEFNLADTEANALYSEKAIAQDRIDAASLARSNAEKKLQDDRSRVFEKQEQLANLQGKLHGVRERLHVLEQLEDQFAGAGRGGQQLLRLARANASPSIPENETVPAPIGNDHAANIFANPWDSVLSLVADIVSTEMHLAPLIDVALGTLSDAIVLRNGQIVDWINDGSLSVDGRVTLLRLDRLPNRRTGEKIQLDGLRGVIGRADRLIRFAPEYESLVRSLLGTTWFVDSLATALDLSHFRGAGLRFVTAECQLIDSDGSITIGSLQAGLGLISRRAEMQTAREEIAIIESNLQIALESVNSLQTQIAEDESNLRKIEAEERQAIQSNSRIEAQLESIAKRKSQLTSRLHEVDLRIQSSQSKIIDTERLSAEIQDEIEDAEGNRIELETIIESHKTQFGILQDELTQRQNAASDQRVSLARLEQRFDGLQLTLQQLQLDAQERIKNVEQAKESLSAIQLKIETTEQSVLTYESELTASKRSAEVIEANRAEQTVLLDTQNNSANQAIRQCESIKRQQEKNEDKIQSLIEAMANVLGQLEQVVSHYANEYQIHLLDNKDLSNIEPHDANESELQRFKDSIQNVKHHEELVSQKTQLDGLVATLRNEIVQAGSVNMEALDELDALQTRFDRLHGHQTDLIEAKESLIKTMAKIDEDSQHLFMETLQNIRRNFQELYRRSFGGGFADIVLENENDPDSGIEIVATPPGKTTLSNSLLSGGEKALTAVALIMSFFQYRPSPFCILDEVDAPFDEANIGRFVTVLKEFLDTTKFIVVTHSKKTMTAANMIYGVTMQESGVSRQVSVRFEEVNDKGEILAPQRRQAA